MLFESLIEIKIELEGCLHCIDIYDDECISRFKNTACTPNTNSLSKGKHLLFKEFHIPDPKVNFILNFKL